MAIIRWNDNQWKILAFPGFILKWPIQYVVSVFFGSRGTTKMLSGEGKFWLITTPFIICSTAAIALGILMRTNYLGSSYIYDYIALSMGIHAVPTREEVFFLEKINLKGFKKYLFNFYWTIDLLKGFWLEVWYSVLMVYGIPSLYYLLTNM